MTLNRDMVVRRRVSRSEIPLSDHGLCRIDHIPTGEHPNSVCVKLPGNTYHKIGVRDDEKISSLKKKMAKALGVKEKNWGIYIAEDNKPLKIVDDAKQINQVNNKPLYFYPKIVIR